MAETKKTTKTTPKTETKATAKTEEVKPKAAAKPKTAPKPAAKPKTAAKPKAAPKPASAPKAEKQAEADSKTKTASAAMPDDWAKMIVNQLIEAQRLWLEMTTQQTAMIFKTVSEVMGMSENAPTEETERNYPVTILRYELVPDSDGPGRWRGSTRRRAARSALEGELGVPDADGVTRMQRLRALQGLPVEKRPVGRSEVLDHDHVAVRRQSGVRPRGEGVLQADVGLVGAPEHGALGEVVGGARAQPGR